MPDGRDAADRLAGVGADEVGRRPAQVQPYAVPDADSRSTRCAPLVMISTGSSSAVAKTSELAIAPTGQPSCSAAA